MRVYELLHILAEMPAGAEVKIRLLKSINEMAICDEDKEYPENSVYEINSNVTTVYQDQYDGFSIIIE